ncbi:MAG: hypothetical protein GY765_32580 [bacterium]|nr:hypothetical protein [bacterium]
MKKKIISFLAASMVTSALVFATFYFFGTGSVKAQETKTTKAVAKKMVKELQKEMALVEKGREQVLQMRAGLKSFEAELDRKHDDYLQKSKALAAEQKDFDEKVEGKMVDRQIIETYENIDPEQAAVLIKNLYQSDRSLATLVMRKIAGKKAGKILEAMIPVDRVTSTRIAEATLNYYKPKKNN